TLFVPIIILFSACLNQDSPELPVYLHLEGAKVKVGEGSFTSQIAVKDFWMSHNANNFGVHRIPRIVPMVPEEGRNTIFINGGVFENGLSGFRVPYPFWRAVAIDINAESLDTVKVNPTIEYLSTDTVIRIAFDASFEPGTDDSFSNFSQGNNSTQILKSTTAAFQGDLGARADFSQTNYQLEALGNKSVLLPQVGGNDVWMEITYKNTVPFTPGLFYTVPGTGETGDLNSGVFFDSNGEWTTSYIHVNQQVRSVIGTALFIPYIRATSQFPNSDSIGVGSIFVDNVRILHFR
ncbi:MAG: hypothetical protein MRZ79_18925, partial [Bacteroidia bacterium]|nr:hypothetical protein [Bacteroidia bacterium]